MKIIAHYFLSACLLYSPSLFSQSKDFEPGYYISQQGDTLKGYVSLNKGREIRHFNFKKQSTDSAETSIQFEICKAVASGDQIFINWFGTRKLTYVDKYEFNIKNFDSSITGNIPLRLIYKGNRLSLYHYEDIMDHFFVDDGTTIHLLTQSYRYITDWEKKQYQVNPHNYFITPIYRDQLIAILKNQLTKKQISMLEVTLLEKRSLLKLFKVLNRS